MDAVRYCFTTNRRWVPISRLDFWFEAGSCKSSISSHQQYYNYKSSPTLLKLKCKQESKCPWSLRAAKRKGDELWEIKKYKGPHTCVSPLMNMDHRQLDVAYISFLDSPVVRADLSISISTIQATIQQITGTYFCTYRKAWLAKQRVIADLFGD